MDFVKTRRKYGLFVAQNKAGKISALELEEKVSQLEVIDQYGNRWQLGVRSGNWYRFDGSAWIEDLPPIPPDTIDSTFVASSDTRSPGKSSKKIVKRRPPQASLQPILSPWHIVIESGQLTGKRISIEQSLALGRDRRNKGYLDDQEASRKHAIIERSGREYLLTDLNSTNGTLLNGISVHQPTILKPGDCIKIGNTDIRVEGDSPTPHATMMSVKRPPKIVSGGPVSSQPLQSGPPPPPPSAQRSQSAPSGPPPPPQFAQSPFAPTLPPPPPSSKPKNRKGCTCLLIGLVIVFVIIASLVALVYVGVIPLPNVLTSWGNATVNIGNQATVLIENYLDSTICYVYISPTTMDNWGGNLLGEGETITPGGNYTFNVSVSDSVDTQVLDCNQTLLYEQYGTPLTSEGITYTLSPIP